MVRVGPVPVDPALEVAVLGTPGELFLLALAVLEIPSVQVAAATVVMAVTVLLLKLLVAVTVLLLVVAVAPRLLGLVRSLLLLGGASS